MNCSSLQRLLEGLVGMLVLQSWLDAFFRFCSIKSQYEEKVPNVNHTPIRNQMSMLMIMGGNSMNGLLSAFVFLPCSLDLDLDGLMSGR